MDFSQYNLFTEQTFELAMTYTNQAILEKRYTHPEIIVLNEGHKNTFVIDGFVFKLYIYKEFVRPTLFIENLLKIKNDDEFMFHLSKLLTNEQYEEIIYESCYINELSYKFYFIHNNGELVYINPFFNYIMFIRPFIPGCTLDMIICNENDDIVNYELGKSCGFTQTDYNNIVNINKKITGSKQIKYMGLSKNIIIKSLINKYKSISFNTNIKPSNIIINDNGISIVDQYHLIFYTTFYHNDATNNSNMKIHFQDKLYMSKGLFNRNSKSFGLSLCLISLMNKPRNNLSGFKKEILSYHSDDQYLNNIAKQIYNIINWETEAPYPNIE